MGMNSIESLRKFGTITLGSDFMGNHIGIVGDTLHLGVWLEFVPDVFKSGLHEAIEKVSRMMCDDKCTKVTVEEFISLIQIEIHIQHVRGYLTNRGWNNYYRGPW